MPGMIVAPQPEAVEAGAAVLARGGNAIDAAIACAFVQGWSIR
jgi:gamma-glutamyltranspeptidase/glutathione hydrolase